MMNPMNQIGGRGWDQNYYDNNYQRNECMFGCPVNSQQGLLPVLKILDLEI